MEFDKDIAVIQAAVQLADKLCEDGLKKLGKCQINNKLKEVLKDAVLEVVNGLMRDLDSWEQQCQRFKVTSLLVVMAIKAQEAGDSEDYWYAALIGMPRISMDVLFEIVKSCHLGSVFFKIIDCLRSELKGKFFLRIIPFIQEKTDDLDVKLYVDLMDYLFLTQNSFVFIKPLSTPQELAVTEEQTELTMLFDQLSKLDAELSHSKTSPHKDPQREVDLNCDPTMTSVLKDALHCCDGILNRKVSIQQQVRLLMSMVNVYTLYMNRECILVTDSDFLARQLESFLVDFSQSQKKTTLSCSEVESLFVEFQDQLVFAEESHRGRSRVQRENDMMEQVCKYIQKLATIVQGDFCDNGMIDYINQLELSRLSDNKGKKWKPQDMNQKKGSHQWKGKNGEVQRKLISPSHFRSIMQNMIECRNEDIRCSSGSSSREEKIKNSMVKCEKLLNQEKKIEDEKKTHKDDQIWDWCILAVRHSLHGNKELFSDLLEKDAPKIITRWLACVETNLHLLTPTAVMTQWLHLVQRHVHKKSPAPILNTMRMVTLAAYRQMPLGKQDVIIKYVHENFDSAQLFGVNQSFDGSMTVTFNRLVNSKADFLKCVEAVSSLALKSPQKTLMKVVDVAVHNKGQAKLLAQILHQLPELCQLKVNNQVTILGDLIGQAVTWERSRSEDQNLLSFVSQLLSVKTSGPVLCPGTVLTETVLPNLTSLDSCEGQGQPKVSITMTLNLLRVLLVTSLEPSCDWLTDAKPLPLLLYLCEMIDRCGTLWEEPGGDVTKATNTSRDLVKELLVDVTPILVSTVTKHCSTVPMKSLSWLYNRIQRLYWTTRLYITPLFKAVNEQKYPVQYPENLADLRDISDGETIPMNGDGVYYLLELCAVSNETVDKTTSCLRHDILRGDHMLYSRVIAALAMLIPQSLPRECERMLKCVIAMVTAGSLETRSRTVTNIKPPPAVYKDAVVELAVSDVLNDVLMVLRSNVLQSADQQALLHLSKCHVSMLKVFCLNVARLDKLDKPSMLFVLAETFCRLCHQMEYFPDGPAEPLFVLLLDVLQTYSNARSALADNVDSVLRNHLANQLEGMTVAAEQCQRGDRTMLIKKLEKEGKIQPLL